MKFNLDDFKIYTPFGELKNGEVFYTEASGTLWMKLCDAIHNSAVALDDGTVCTFGEKERVIKVNVKCEITISH